MALSAARTAGLTEKITARERLTRQDNEDLYASDDLAWLGGLAHGVRTEKNCDATYFNVNRHLNVTNVCTASCAYCSFQRKPGQNDAYAMRVEEAVSLASAMKGDGLTELHIVNGLHPTLPWKYYPRVLRELKAALTGRPGVHRHRGARLRIDLRAVRVSLIRDAGFRPVERNTSYQVIREYDGPVSLAERGAEPQAVWA